MAAWNKPPFPLTTQKAVIKMEEQNRWLLCPVCHSKTRVKLREDTVLHNFLLFCPKCRQEALIDVKQFSITQLQK